MKMKLLTGWGSAVAAAATVLIAACSSSSHPMNPSLSGQSLVNFSEINGPMPSCPNGFIYTRVIRVGLDLSNPVRSVRFGMPEVNQHEENNDNNSNWGSNLTSTADPYDVDVTNSTIFPTDENYAQIRILLPLDGKYSFFRLNSNSPQQPVWINGVGLGDGKNNTGVCGNAFYPYPDSDSLVHVVASFYIPMHKAGISGKQSNQINILVSPVKSPSTQIFIDPKVQNNG